MTKKFLFPVLLLAFVAGCSFIQKDDHTSSSTDPTGPGDPVFVTLAADPVPDLMDCIDNLFTYDITARAHNATAPMTLEIDFGDGTSSSVDATVLVVRHTYHGCGTVTSPELGWTIKATVTVHDGSQAFADRAIYPCSQC